VALSCEARKSSVFCSFVCCWLVPGGYTAVSGTTTSSCLSHAVRACRGVTDSLLMLTVVRLR
jgi:hypothetical protein